MNATEQTTILLLGVILSGSNTAILLLGMFILTDLRRRVTRLENDYFNRKAEG